jgi:hypothetical protein
MWAPPIYSSSPSPFSRCPVRWPPEALLLVRVHWDVAEAKYAPGRPSEPERDYGQERLFLCRQDAGRPRHRRRDEGGRPEDATEYGVLIRHGV